MRKPGRCMLVLSLLLFAAASTPAPPVAAHNSFPAREEQIAAGPYSFTLLLFNEKINAGDTVQILLVPADTNPGTPPLLHVRALPGPGIAAALVEATLRPDENDERMTAADLVIPTEGPWQIVVTAGGPAGGGSAAVDVAVAPPPLIPLWAGWLIALTPLLGLVWFAFQQRAMMRRAAAT